MDTRRLIGLAIGVVLGIIAVLVINGRIAELERKINQLEAEGRIITVVIAKKDIKQGEVIKENMVGLSQVPRREVHGGVIQSIDSVVGKIARQDIFRKQIIYQKMVKLPQGERSLAELTPQGKVALSISIDRISAVGGAIKNGDNVDVIAILPPPQKGSSQMVLTLFQNIKVLDVTRRGTVIKSITLALTHEQAKILTLVLQIGKIKLALRSPLDTTSDVTFVPVSYETLLRKIYEAMGVSFKKPPPKKQGPVIYKGGVKE